jgi:hypothetical protein
MKKEQTPISPKQASDADYWRDRAKKAKRQAQSYQDRDTRDHLMKIVAGYEELAERAEGVQREMSGRAT